MDLKLVAKIVCDAFRRDQLTIPKSDVLTFACDNDRYVELDGKKYSPIINTVEDALKNRGFKAVSVTRLQSRIKGKLSHGVTVSPEGAFARAFFTKRLKSFFTKKGQYPYSRQEERVWSKILIQARPKIVLGITPSRELCTACHKLNIWVADIQHGVISDSHPWYNESQRGHDKREWLPDAFFCWDKSSAATIEKWAKKLGILTEVIGNPWVNRFIMSDSEDFAVQTLKKKYDLNKTDKPTILLSFSWGCANIPNEVMVPELERFILSTLDKYNWKFRLHPNQLQGFATDSGDRFFKHYEQVFANSGIDWQLTSAMPLPILLSITDIHLTWSSSVCLEAAYFGVRSLLLDPELQPGGILENHYQELVDNKYIDKILPTEEGISNWVERNKSLKMTPYNNHVGAYSKMIDDLANRINK